MAPLLAAAAPAVKPAHVDHTSSSRSRSAARSRQLPGGSPAPAQQGAPPSWGTIPSSTNPLGPTATNGTQHDSWQLNELGQGAPWARPFKEMAAGRVSMPRGGIDTPRRFRGRFSRAANGKSGALLSIMMVTGGDGGV